MHALEHIDETSRIGESLYNTHEHIDESSPVLMLTTTNFPIRISQHNMNLRRHDLACYRSDGVSSPRIKVTAVKRFQLSSASFQKIILKEFFIIIFSSDNYFSPITRCMLYKWVHVARCTQKESCEVSTSKVYELRLWPDANFGCNGTVTMLLLGVDFRTVTWRQSQGFVRKEEGPREKIRIALGAFSPGGVLVYS